MEAPNKLDATTSPHFSPVGVMIAQEFGFTGDFPKERNTPRIAD
jgi:hypothetical protein